jgi:hypothetical protein
VGRMQSFGMLKQVVHVVTTLRRFQYCRHYSVGQVNDEMERIWKEAVVE